MPEPFANDRERDAGSDEQRGADVSQVVKANPREFGARDGGRTCGTGMVSNRAQQRPCGAT